MSSAIATGGSIVVTPRQDGVLARASSSIIMIAETKDPPIRSPKQFPQIFPVDVNANDFAFSVEKAFPSLSKVGIGVDGKSIELSKDDEKTEWDKDQLTIQSPPPLSEAFAGVDKYLECSGVVRNPVHFVGCELKTSQKAEVETVDRRDSDTHRYMNLRKKSKRRLLEDRPRQKRQAARDMCRPLKQWLYCHRDTPYPSKSEKQDLAFRSHMTLTQVSNWFANARRRLKNTVSGGPDVTWAKRIKLYNRFVVGNQELLSISSDDTMWNEEEVEETMETERLTTRTSDHQCHPVVDNLNRKEIPDGSSRLSGLSCQPDMYDESGFLMTTVPPNGGIPPAKFKQGILQRYLTDACERVIQIKAKREHEEEEGEVEEDEEDDYDDEEDEEDDDDEEERQTIRRQRNRFRNASGSLSSHDYEEMSLSAPGTPTKDHRSNSNEIQNDVNDNKHRNRSGSDRDGLYWKEISAALALTSLAMRSKLNSVSSRTSSSRM